MVTSFEKAAAKRAYLKAGGDVDKAADALAVQVGQHPADFPGIRRLADQIMRERLEKLIIEVVMDMPDLAGNPEAIVAEAKLRLSARFSRAH